MRETLSMYAINASLCCQPAHGAILMVLGVARIHRAPDQLMEYRS